MPEKKTADTSKELEDFLRGKSAHARELFDHFVQQYQKLAPVTVHPAKTMIGIATPRKRICYVTQIGKDFIHVTFPFEAPYADNLCFQKIAQVPGQQQYNHHFRMYNKEDLNAEVKKFMKLAYTLGV
jgi:hypothetical protein